jgi:hypothetical protein
VIHAANLCVSALQSWIWDLDREGQVSRLSGWPSCGQQLRFPGTLTPSEGEVGLVGTSDEHDVRDSVR